MARVPRRTLSPPCALAAFPPRVPPRPRVRAQGLRARSRKHRGLAAPFSRSRLGADSAPPRAGAFAPGPPRPTGLHPRRRGACEDSLLLRRPVWSDAGPDFLFLAWSRASASEVKSVRPQSRTGASPAGVMGTRAEEGLAAPLTSPPLPPHPGALGPPREPTLAAVASWQVTRSWAPGP